MATKKKILEIEYNKHFNKKNFLHDGKLRYTFNDIYRIGSSTFLIFPTKNKFVGCFSVNDSNQRIDENKSNETNKTDNGEERKHILKILQKDMPFAEWRVQFCTIKQIYDKKEDRDKILKTKAKESKQHENETTARKNTDSRNRQSLFDDPPKSLLFHKEELNKLHARENQIEFGFYHNYSAQIKNQSETEKGKEKGKGKFKGGLKKQKKKQKGVIVAMDIDHMRKLHQELGDFNIANKIVEHVYDILCECVLEEIANTNNNHPDKTKNKMNPNYYALSRSGDEFVIKVPDFVTAYEVCLKIQEKLKSDDTLKTLLPDKHNKLTLTMGIGGCLSNADRATNAAKLKDKRNCIVANIAVSWIDMISTYDFTSGIDYTTATPYQILRDGKDENDDKSEEDRIAQCQKILDNCKKSHQFSKVLKKFDFGVKTFLFCVLIALFIDVSHSLPLQFKAILIGVTGIIAQWVLSKKMKFKNDNKNVYDSQKEETSRTNEFGDGDFQHNQISTKAEKLLDWALFPMLSLEPQWDQNS